MSILHLLSHDGYLIVNKYLAKDIGLETAVILAALCGIHLSLEKKNLLHSIDNEEGFFFETSEDLEEETTLSRYQQDKAIKILLEIGFISQKNSGLPCKRYFKINETEIEAYFSKTKSRLRKTYKQGFKKFANWSLYRTK